MSFDVEQVEILNIIDRTIGISQSRQRMRKRFSWNRFNGDVVCRIVSKSLAKHLQPDRKPVGPGVYSTLSRAPFTLESRRSDLAKKDDSINR